MAATTLRFPQGFVFGTATSSYQIEGAASEDGRTGSIWDRFCATPGKIVDGSNGDIACDHYHRYPEDINLMRSLGINGYRFSIAWPRIIPHADGRVNEAGLDFYDRLVDGLLEAGITPFATLYHWDLPLWLEDQGGWRVRASIPAFEAYSDAVSRRLGDRVKHWMTHNEPWCTAILGHAIGVHAPGEKNVATAIQVAHHVLVSHGAAVPVLRANSPGAEIGIAPNFSPARPASDSSADKDAVMRHDGFANRWFIDPLAGRGYPEDIVDLYGALPAMEAGDLAQIAVPIDFLGVNFYNEVAVADDPNMQPLRTRILDPVGDDVTTMGWEVTPHALENLLLRLSHDYGFKKLYITENGCAYPDTLSDDGQIHDDLRVTFLHKHFAAAERAIERGAPLAGFFVWSFLDNFEWAFGYTQRFGIVYTDYQTQQRTPKESARWYKDLIASQG